MPVHQRIGGTDGFGQRVEHIGESEGGFLVRDGDIAAGEFARPDAVKISGSCSGSTSIAS